MKGMDRFLSHFHIPLEESLAVGDGGNDLEMIMHAGYSCAMKESNPVLFDHADYVCSDVEEEGVTDCFRHYGLL